MFSYLRNLPKFHVFENKQRRFMLYGREPFALTERNGLGRARRYMSNQRTVSYFFMNQSIHIGEKIRNHLATQKRSVAWLATHLCCDPSSLRKVLKKSYIHTDLLYRISSVLGKDFFAYYSQLLSDKKI